MHRKVKYKNRTNFNPGLMLISLPRTGPSTIRKYCPIAVAQGRTHPKTCSSGIIKRWNCSLHLIWAGRRRNQTPESSEKFRFPCENRTHVPPSSSSDAPMITIFRAYLRRCSSNPIFHHLMHHLKSFRHFQLILVLLLLDALCDRVPHLSFKIKPPRR